jgi:hypothetical protein
MKGNLGNLGVVKKGKKMIDNTTGDKRGGLPRYRYEKKEKNGERKNKDDLTSLAHL